MIIDDKIIDELEGLAKVRLTDSEKEKVKKELGEMLQHMEILGELDANGVEPLNHVFDLSNAMREDEVRPSLSNDEILKNAPENTDGCFSVPKAFE